MLENLSVLRPESQIKRKRIVDSFDRSYGTGKRKTSIARVWVKPGTGKILVNGKISEEYFLRPTLQIMIRQPFIVSNRSTQYDVWCTVVGGGLSGQAGAVRHGISKALGLYEPDLVDVLKSEKFLTRDVRIVERKKYGHPKARKRFQFSKR